MTRKPLQAWILPFVIGGLAGATLVGPVAAEVLYVASPNQVVVIDSESGKQLGEVPIGGHTVFDIVFTADRKRGYLACDDGVVEVDAQKHLVLSRIMKGPSFDLELSADGKLLYVLGNEVMKRPDGQQEALPSTITTYDLGTRAEVATKSVGRGCQHMTLAAGRAAIMRPEVKELALVNPTEEAFAGTAVQLADPNGEAPGFVNGLATSQDGREVYVGVFGEPSKIEVVDAASGSTRAIAFPHEGFITGIGVSRDGKSLYVSTRNHLTVLDATSGAERSFIALNGAHTSMSMSPSGRYSYHPNQAFDDKGGAVTVVNLASGQVRAIPTPGMSPITVAALQ
jgi:DNA-binding beta-propeller fold protein YncE